MGLAGASSSTINIDPLAKRVNREHVKEKLDSRQKTISATRADKKVVSERRPFELRSFQDLFISYNFVPKILEHVGGITKLGSMKDKLCLSQLLEDLSFKKYEICFPHCYPRTKATAKLFNVRSDRDCSSFTFNKADRELHDEVISFLKNKGIKDNPKVSDLEDIFKAAGWTVRDPKDIWRWEVYANKDTLRDYGIFINDNNTFTFHDDIGIKKDWDPIRMKVLIGNKVKGIKLEDFPRRDFIIDTLNHQNQDGSNQRIGSTIQLREIFEALGFTYVEESPREQAIYERRKALERQL